MPDAHRVPKLVAVKVLLILIHAKLMHVKVTNVKTTPLVYLPVMLDSTVNAIDFKLYSCVVAATEDFLLSPAESRIAFSRF